MNKSYTAHTYPYVAYTLGLSRDTAFWGYVPPNYKVHISFATWHRVGGPAIHLRGGARWPKWWLDGCRYTESGYWEVLQARTCKP